MHDHETTSTTESGDTYQGRAQGGLGSAEGRAAYWRMNHEYAIHALSDLLTEHRELVEATAPLVAGLRVEAERLRGIGVASVALWMENEADRLQVFLPPE